MTPIAEESLAFHAQKRGKIEVISTVKVNDAHDLSVAYTPGVAQPCLEIQKDVDQSYELTRRWNMAAGPGRHRAGGWYAGDGGEMRAL